MRIEKLAGAANTARASEGCDVLVLAAFPPELLAIRRALGIEKGTEAGEAVNGANIVTATVGIGLVAAAVGSVRALASSRPARVLLLGTCGAYAGAGIGVLDVVAAHEVVLADPGVADGRAAFVGPMAAALACDAEAAGALVAAGAVRARVATTLALTTDDGLADRLARSFAASAEHLEAYAVALACAAAGVPFCAALGVANPVGTAGREAWMRHHLEASERAASVALALLAKWAVRGATAG